MVSSYFLALNLRSNEQLKKKKKKKKKKRYK